MGGNLQNQLMITKDVRAYANNSKGRAFMQNRQYVILMF